MNVDIRNVTTQDIPTVVTLVNNIMEEFNLPMSEESIREDIQSFLGDATKQRIAFWVALEEKNLVGSIAILPRSGAVCILKRFYVKQEYRGNGIGRKLYLLAEQFAEYAQYTSIELLASRRFSKAIEFYRRNGFQLREELENAWEDNIYVKLLDSSV